MALLGVQKPSRFLKTSPGKSSSHDELTHSLVGAVTASLTDLGCPDVTTPMRRAMS